ncbi:hypothetical protein ACN4EG_18470 [Alkalinema pantanalense CENA528]|uniref:hypothetical protein n=1 Tax=Alkalinema pantanalense TaxID=1620705 RepID=UPI003D6F7BF6
MKRRHGIRSGLQANATPKLTVSNDWISYITKVLALIGLWQVLANSTRLLTHWF